MRGGGGENQAFFAYVIYGWPPTYIIFLSHLTLSTRSSDSSVLSIQYVRTSPRPRFIACIAIAIAFIDIWRENKDV